MLEAEGELPWFFWGLNLFLTKKHKIRKLRIRDLYQGQSSSRLAFYSLGIFFRETPILLAKDLGKQKTQGDVEKKKLQNLLGQKNTPTPLQHLPNPIPSFSTFRTSTLYQSWKWFLQLDSKSERKIGKWIILLSNPSHYNIQSV